VATRKRSVKTAAAPEHGGQRQSTASPEERQAILHSIIVDALLDPEQRKSIGMPAAEDVPMHMILELNLQHAGGLAGAADRIHRLWTDQASPQDRPQELSNAYYHVRASMLEIIAVVWRDYKTADAGHRAILRVWPDFPVRGQSVGTYRTAGAAASALAAQRSYTALGDGITWALLDSGIDASHPHFRGFDTLGGGVTQLHRNFVAAKNDSALTDRHGHGTHNAGIIAGSLPKRLPRGMQLTVAQQVSDPLAPSGSSYNPVSADPVALAGIAPQCKLVSCKVLDDDATGNVSNIIRALCYIGDELNDTRRLRVHGVMLGVGYGYDPTLFACGHTPLCVEVDRLVRSGVVVVAAAGNTGFGTLSTLAQTFNSGMLVTINDPGNAALAITVGATHRDAPHSYGVSYFSSKGPTADGRLKPDVVAPGERIMSCAAGRLIKLVYPEGLEPPRNAAPYIDQTGTSAAAAYVCGAIAAFLSVHREFIGRPEEVKRIFLDTAISLGRETYFQGRGMVNLLQALQSV
jgi:serine protease AprX